MRRDSSAAERLICNEKVAGFNSRLPAPLILSGHQPVYLPGIQLFNKIALSDAFMFVGHCQYSPKSWQTRNYIRQGNDKIMLSVPVEKSLGQPINKTKILGGNWRQKHIRSIEQSYRKRPFFDSYFPALSQAILFDWESLAAMNIVIIITILEWLKIETRVCVSESFNIQGAKTDMLISMCNEYGASEYLSNEGSRAYVEEDKIARHALTHRWQRFTHPVYEQGYREFIPNLSAIDLLFNCGPDAARIVRECGHVGSVLPRPCHEQL